MIGNSPITVSDDDNEPTSTKSKLDSPANVQTKNQNKNETQNKKSTVISILPVDNTSTKNGKKNKIVKKRRNTSKKDTYDSMPFWIKSPKDVKEIPSHIKSVCDRLMHVEKQIKKFCVERQGLLATLWKLKGEGCGNLFPDPVLKSLTLFDVEEKPDENEIETPENETQQSEIDEKLNYNDLDSYKLKGEEDKLWKSTWLTNDGQVTPLKTPTIKKLISYSNTRTDSSMDYPRFSSQMESRGIISNLNLEESQEIVEHTREPIQFFKNLDFTTLTQTDINTWRKFFGLKKMPDHELVKEIEKIRDYLVSFVDA